MEPAVLSALRQLQLIIVGATIGTIGGSLVLRLSDDFRPVVVTAIVGVVLLGLSFVLQRFPSQTVPRLAPAYSSRIGRVIVTLAAALSVVLAFDLLVASDARTMPARPHTQATVTCTCRAFADGGPGRSRERGRAGRAGSAADRCAPAGCNIDIVPAAGDRPACSQSGRDATCVTVRDTGSTAAVSPTIGRRGVNAG